MPEKVLHFGEEAYKQALTKINELIAGKKHTVGDSLTIVDFLFAEIIMNAEMIKTDYEHDYPHIWAYYQGLLAEVPVLKEHAAAVKETLELL